MDGVDNDTRGGGCEEGEKRQNKMVPLHDQTRYDIDFRLLYWLTINSLGEERKMMMMVK